FGLELVDLLANSAIALEKAFIAAAKYLGQHLGDGDGHGRLRNVKCEARKLNEQCNAQRPRRIAEAAQGIKAREAGDGIGPATSRRARRFGPCGWAAAARATFH